MPQIHFITSLEICQVKVRYRMPDKQIITDDVVNARLKDDE